MDPAAQLKTPELIAGDQKRHHRELVWLDVLHLHSTEELERLLRAARPCVRVDQCCPRDNVPPQRHLLEDTAGKFQLPSSDQPGYKGGPRNDIPARHSNEQEMGIDGVAALTMEIQVHQRVLEIDISGEAALDGKPVKLHALAELAGGSASLDGEGEREFVWLDAGGDHGIVVREEPIEGAVLQSESSDHEVPGEGGRREGEVGEGGGGSAEVGGTAEGGVAAKEGGEDGGVAGEAAAEEVGVGLAEAARRVAAGGAEKAEGSPGRGDSAEKRNGRRVRGGLGEGWRRRHGGSAVCGGEAERIDWLWKGDLRAAIRTGETGAGLSFSFTDHYHLRVYFLPSVIPRERKKEYFFPLFLSSLSLISLIHLSHSSSPPSIRLSLIHLFLS